MTAIGLLVIALLLLASAFLAASETALLGTPPAKEGAKLAAGGANEDPADGSGERRGGQNRERLLPALLVGSTLVEVGAAAVASGLASAQGLPGGALVAAFGMTVILFVIGELLPREIGRRRRVGWLQAAGPALDWLARLLGPLAHVFNKAARTLLLLVGLDPRELHPRVPPGDLRFLFRTGAGTGLQGLGTLSGAGQDLRSLFDFSQTAAREVMIPLTDVKLLPASARVSDVLELVRTTPHTRFPVFGTRKDEILGILNVYDILYSDFEPEEPIRRFIRPGLYVPNTVAMDKLLVQMQSRKMPLAVVVDEFGGADGIVTVKDVVEEVVGSFELRSAGEESPIQRQGDDSYLLDGHVSLDRLNRELGLDLPKKSYETLAGFLMTEMERIPEEGDRFTFQDLMFTVSKAKRHTIQKVLLRLRR